MFELSIALKYLIPRRKHISVTLIATLSVVVISLVVWLLLVFLSVTKGMEVAWLKKLTDLQAPIRITPTPAYYSSYYYKIDSLSASSGFSYKTIGQKQNAFSSDPYNPEEDPEIPSLWAKPVLHKGKLEDPVKDLYHILQDLQTRYSGFVFQDYEMSGAMLKLQLLRSDSPSPAMMGNETLNFLTQVSYLSTFPGQVQKIHSLLMSPTADDINHLFFLANYRWEGTTRDGPPDVLAESEEFSKKVQSLFSHLDIHTLKTTSLPWKMPLSFLPKDIVFTAYGTLQGPNLLQIEVPSHPRALRKQEQKGTLKYKENKWVFSLGKMDYLLHESTPLLLNDPVIFKAKLQKNGVEKARRLSDLQFALQGNLQGHTIQGVMGWKDLAVDTFSIKTEPAQTTPPWLYKTSASQEWVLPKNGMETGILLPKSFQENEVRIGDIGFLSYTASTVSSTQEQRLKVFVAGFYDPGILSVGNKCILVPSSVTQTINAVNTSFTFDKIALNGIQVWFDDLYGASNIKKQIESELEKQNLNTYWTVTSYKEYDHAKELLQQFQSDKYLFSLVGLIILIVACSNILSFLILLVNDKKKEIGILQAMGASPKSIGLIFGSCGMIVGFLGSAIGITAAILTLSHIDGIVAALSALQGHDAFQAAFYGTSLPRELSSDAVVFILITTPILSLCAGLVPALKACKLRPSAILRSEV